MQTIIIEDEQPSARRLKRMLAQLNISVETLLHSVEEAIEWLSNNPNPDLIFLDIQLSDGLSFEIFDVISIESAIIFTTAYDEYALKAFKLNSVDYLLKPIDDEELEKAVHKYKQHFKNGGDKGFSLNDLKTALSLQKENSYKTRFTSKVGEHIKVFHVNDIECFYSENKGTYLYTSTNRNYLIDSILENLETQLDPQEFFRVSRKFIVNFKAIDDIITYSSSRLKVKLNTYDDQEIIVSRERVKEFKAWLE